MMILNKLISLFENRKMIRRARSICKNNSIRPAHSIDLEDASVILDIFLKRVYSTCFPFHEDATIVDIGAHKGFFSIYSDKHSGNNATIHALEPEPSNFEQLIANVKLNGCSKVTPVNIGVSDKTGEEKLHLGKSVNHSIVESYNNHAGTNSNTITISTITLSDFIKDNEISKIDFLKIDCEGFEYKILFNTPGHVFDIISTISLEFHDLNSDVYNINKLVKHLVKHGYQIVRYEFQETPQPLQMGILVMTKKGR